jgi:hypothetical protein
MIPSEDGPKASVRVSKEIVPRDHERKLSAPDFITLKRQVSLQDAIDQLTIDKLLETHCDRLGLWYVGCTHLWLVKT